MLTSIEINRKYDELVSKWEQLEKVASAIREACSDLAIKISKEDIAAMELLIEQTGQFRVLKKDYTASWETFRAQLKNAGYSDTAVKYMTEMLRFVNWKDD